METGQRADTCLLISPAASFSYSTDSSNKLLGQFLAIFKPSYLAVTGIIVYKRSFNIGFDVWNANEFFYTYMIFIVLNAYNNLQIC